ncbi:FkbM family methyltransferase [Hydrogenophilus hirschii]
MVKIIINRFRKIQKSIRSEGLIAYLLRLYQFGEWRRFLYLGTRFFRNRTTAPMFGYSLKLSARWEGLTEELVLMGVHEPIATETYKTLISPGKTIIDVGSNIGYYMALADSIMNGNGQIHGFEPDPELYLLLDENTRQFKTKTKINNLAVCDKQGQILFYTSEASNWGSILQHSALKQQQAINVKCTDIDTYCATAKINPDVIRMDIEGGELYALRGAKKTLLSKPMLFIELHIFMFENEQLEEIIDILSKPNYSMATWTNRYYDTPWSSRASRAGALYRGNPSCLFRAIKERDFAVMGIFLS